MEIGINNTGDTELSGTVVLDLANVDDGLQQKNIWLELTGQASATNEMTVDVSSDDATLVGSTQLTNIQLESGLWLQDFGFILRPNPDEEEIVLSFVVAPHSYDVVNTVQVATQSIPEASTWAMLAVGFAGLGFAGYRGKARKPPFAV